MAQTVEGQSIPGFFDEAVYPAGSQGNLFVKGFDLRQQTTGLRRLRQMETKSGSVFLYTEQDCCGYSSRHSGSSSALKYRPTVTLARPVFMTSVLLETHIKPHHFFGNFFTVYWSWGV